MLTDVEVLNYVKRSLGYPTVTIEFDDDQIRDIIYNRALREFSKWVPDVAVTKILTTDSTYKVKDSENRFYFFDDDDRDIIAVSDVYMSMSQYTLHGYPYNIGPTNYDVLPNVMVQLMRGETAYEYSGMHIVFRYIPPNIIELHMTTIPDLLLVKYLRSHAKDFSTIPYGLTTEFLDLCVAHLKIALGEQRSKYSNYTTNMGDIPINTDLRSEGESLRNDVRERLETIPPDVIIDVD